MPFTEKDVKKIASNISVPKNPPPSKFPGDVLKHMKKNAASKSALKLIKSNKYFISQKLPFIYYGKSAQLHKNRLVFYDVKKFAIDELPNNLGIFGKLHIEDEFLLPRLIPKIILCDLQILSFMAEKISFNDFKFFTSSGNLKKLSLNRTNVIFENDEIVPYEYLLDQTPSLTDLQMLIFNKGGGRFDAVLKSWIFVIFRFYHSSKPLSKNFIEKVCTSNSEKFTLSCITEVFNFEEFLAEIQKKKPKLDVRLFFKKNYKNHERVNSYMEELFATGLTDSCPPLFEFGIYENKLLFINSSKIKDLRNSYFTNMRKRI